MAQKSLSGIISNISEKEWVDNRTGNEVTLYSFQVEGDKRWFRTGQVRPPVNVGGAYRFVFDTTKGNVDIQSIEQAEESEVTRAPKASGNYGKNSGKFPPKGSGNSRDSYWENKDKYYKEVEVPRITYSACQSRAIDVVKMALENEALALPSTKNKRFDALLDMVDEVTARFVEQVNSLGEGGKPEQPNEEGKPFDDEIPFGDEGGWDD